MDNLQWFKFSPSDWMMGRIQRQTAQVQVDFIRLCCKYWQKECILSIEDAELEAMDSYAALLKYKLINEIDGNVIIEFLDEQMVGINARREQASSAGKRSAELRKRSTVVQRSLDSVERNSTEKSRVEKKRVDKSIEEKELVVLQPPHPLITWIQTNTPKVQKLKQPLTNDECTKLLEDLKIDTDIKKVRLKDMLTNMQNYKPLLSKNESANLTIRNWWKRETERETPAQPLNAIKMNDKPYTR
jgi:hypothetical protein